MDLRTLFYFVTVAKEESITRAANSLHITQPTLSRQIKDLEEELGVKLFTRSNHHIHITEAGVLLKQRFKSCWICRKSCKTSLNISINKLKVMFMLGVVKRLEYKLLLRYLKRFNRNTLMCIFIFIVGMQKTLSIV